MKKIHAKSYDGFTLLEVLIALFIFAIVGVVAAVSFRSVIKAHSIVEQRDQEVQQIGMAMTLMRRDFEQTVDRPIIGSDGRKQPSLQSKGLETVEFTRTGVVNPWLMEKRGDLQRVGYSFIKNQLVRLTWFAPDQLPNSKPSQRVLLNNVEAMQIEYIDHKKQSQTSWPLSQGSNVQIMQKASAQSNLPLAVIITLSIKKFGQLKMVFPLRGRGFIMTKARSAQNKKKDEKSAKK